MSYCRYLFCSSHFSDLYLSSSAVNFVSLLRLFASYSSNYSFFKIVFSSILILYSSICRPNDCLSSAAACEFAYYNADICYLSFFITILSSVLPVWTVWCLLAYASWAVTVLISSWSLVLSSYILPIYSRALSYLLLRVLISVLLGLLSSYFITFYGHSHICTFNYCILLPCFVLVSRSYSRIPVSYLIWI